LDQRFDVDWDLWLQLIHQSTGINWQAWEFAIRFSWGLFFLQYPPVEDLCLEIKGLRAISVRQLDHAGLTSPLDASSPKGEDEGV